MKQFFLLYLLLINAASFWVMLVDKTRARKKAWRIPEARLFTLAVLGGSLGIWGGMYAFRHKTRHRAFVWGIPAILVAQGVILLVLRNF